MKNIFLTIIILISIFSCGNNDNKNNSGKLTIYASIYPIYDFTKKIGGEKIAVYNMTKAGAEPHDFEITSKDMANLSKADLFIYNGGGMEHWIDSVKNVLNIKYVDSSSNINNEKN